MEQHQQKFTRSFSPPRTDYFEATIIIVTRLLAFKYIKSFSPCPLLHSPPRLALLTSCKLFQMLFPKLYHPLTRRTPPLLLLTRPARPRYISQSIPKPTESRAERKRIQAALTAIGEGAFAIFSLGYKVGSQFSPVRQITTPCPQTNLYGHVQAIRIYMQARQIRRSLLLRV